MTDKLIYLLPLATAFLYRLGGGGFSWLPSPLNTGHKWARRYGLTLLLCLLDPSPLNLFFMAILAVILTFNLDEIEEKDWDDVFCYGFAIAFCLTLMSSYHALLVGFWWITGVLMSNIGIGKWKLDWFWVELIMGFCIGLSIVVNQYLMGNITW